MYKHDAVPGHLTVTLVTTSVGPYYDKHTPTQNYHDLYGRVNDLDWTGHSDVPNGPNLHG